MEKQTVTIIDSTTDDILAAELMLFISFITKAVVVYEAFQPCSETAKTADKTPTGSVRNSQKLLQI